MVLGCAVLEAELLIMRSFKVTDKSGSRSSIMQTACLLLYPTHFLSNSGIMFSSRKTEVAIILFKSKENCRDLNMLTAVSSAFLKPVKPLRGQRIRFAFAKDDLKGHNLADLTLRGFKSCNYTPFAYRDFVTS